MTVRVLTCTAALVQRATLTHRFGSVMFVFSCSEIRAGQRGLLKRSNAQTKPNHAEEMDQMRHEQIALPAYIYRSCTAVVSKPTRLVGSSFKCKGEGGVTP